MKLPSFKNQIPKLKSIRITKKQFPIILAVLIVGVSLIGYARAVLNTPSGLSTTSSTVNVSEYANLTNAISSIGGNRVDLLIDNATILTANTTIPANINLLVSAKGTINQGTYTLTINGSFSAPNQQVFLGTGSVFGLREVCPGWWGNDAAAINSAIITATENGTKIGTVKIDGTYTVTAPVKLKSHVSLLINGELKAEAGFSGSAVIEGRLEETAGYYTEHFSITGNGIINANNIAAEGVSIHQGRFGKITPRVWGATLYGIRLGHSDALASSYEIHVDNSQIWRGDYANSSESKGIFHENCSDSYVTNVVVQGYRTGVRTDSGSIFYNNVHVWNRASTNGPLQYAFYIGASMAQLTNCYADTPSNVGTNGLSDGSITDVYGYYFDSYNTQATNLNLFVNTSLTPSMAVDNLITGIRINKAGGLFGQISGFHSSTTVNYKLKKTISVASAVNATIQGITDDGNTYGTDVRESTYPVVDPQELRISNDAGVQSALTLLSGGSSRWIVRKTADAESGGDTGSNFEIVSRTDSGAYKSTPFSIDRSTGYIKLGTVPTYADNAAAIAGGMKAGEIYRNGDVLQIVH